MTGAGGTSGVDRFVDRRAR